MAPEFPKPAVTVDVVSPAAGPFRAASFTSTSRLKMQLGVSSAKRPASRMFTSSNYLLSAIRRAIHAGE